MPRSNRTEYAILGLLAMAPRSGYDIKNEVEEKLGHFWSESYGQIYPVLRRLVARDLAVRTEEKVEGRPTRYVYSLTDDGWAALREWFSEETDFARPRNELLLKLFFGPFASPGVLGEQVRRFQDESVRRIELLESVLRQLENESRDRAELAYWSLTIRYGLHALRGVVDWCQEAVAELDGMEPGP